ncbi:MAG: DUF4166 domain-containing protein [Brevundimonas sp.]|uniref:DUF4166 domain-containing protein n=1 Tax=Brevundimonas sp. TaxID=1871086 RepID=UPI004034C86D
MNAVFLIGAGGVFGSRLAQGLARDGFEVVCAGRDLNRAQTVAARLVETGGAARAVALDARTLTAEALRSTGAAIVVDAAGPFHNAAPTVARAAIAAGLPYVDLADARDFVAAFPALDAAARAASVVALTGASSTPALSNAVLDDLTAGWCEVMSVEAAISPGARAPRGRSVVEAILSWTGRPVRVFEKGRWRSRPGWSGLVTRDFGPAGRRRLSLCETPDLDLLPARFRPTRSALFLAGLEPPILHWGMSLTAAFAAATGFRLRPLAGLLTALSGLFAPFGSDRGAMRVEAFGIDARGRAVRAEWRLVAEPGVGPVVPTLAALAAVKAIAAGTLVPGARACVGDLPLAALEAELDAHPLIRTRTTERAALFARAIGPDFDALPDPIRALHESLGLSQWRGECRCDGPASPLAGLVGRIIGFPGRSGTEPVEVSIDADGRRSIWRRHIGPARFQSVLSNPRAGGRMTERFGLVSVELGLHRQADRLVYDVLGWRLGPIPLPRALAPRTTTHEAIDAQGRFTFDVEIGLPLLGRIVHYRGWLTPAEGEDRP